MITVENITKTFGSFNAVDNLSFEVPDNAFLVLVGPSGCGKSTMLRMLAGLETPSDGKISFDGNTVSDGAKQWLIKPENRNTGLVFQSYALWPHMTVAGNVEWPLKVAKWSSSERKKRVTEVLDLLAIGDLAHRYPNEISGGQQQRVAIARMIGPKPRILLFDEPLSNLDAKLRVEMRTELIRIHRATGATSVYVTHDQVEALSMASHVAVMNEGRIEQFGPPNDLIDAPASAFVATFIGTPPANLVPFEMRDGTLMHGAIQLAKSAIDTESGFALYRAEDIEVSLSPIERAVKAYYAESSPLAGQTMIIGVDNDFRITAVVSERLELEQGQEVYFQLPENPRALFNSEGNRL